MQVVLNADVKHLGYRGDVVIVKRGYFRNHLLPLGLAVIATKAELNLVESRKGKMLMKKSEILDKAKDVLVKLKGLTVEIFQKVSDKGHLYGSVAEDDVIKVIEDATNLSLDKDFIKMEHIKELGSFEVEVDLGDGLKEVVVVEIKPLK